MQQKTAADLLLSAAVGCGDPYGIRTHVNGVRGRCLNHLTKGPDKQRDYTMAFSRLSRDKLGQNVFHLSQRRPRKLWERERGPHKNPNLMDGIIKPGPRPSGSGIGAEIKICAVLRRPASSPLPIPCPLQNPGQRKCARSEQIKNPERCCIRDFLVHQRGLEPRTR